LVNLRKNKNPHYRREADFFPSVPLPEEKTPLRDPRILESGEGGVFIVFQPSLRPPAEPILTTGILYAASETASATAAEPRNSAKAPGPAAEMDPRGSDPSLSAGEGGREEDAPLEALREAPARYLGTYQGGLLFLLPELPPGFLASGVHLARLDGEAPAEIPPERFILFGRELFLDPARGWLTEVSSAKGKSPGRWESLSREGFPEPGLAFVSTTERGLKETLLRLLKFRDLQENVLLLGSDLFFFEELLEELPDKEELFYPHLEAPAKLFPLSAGKIKLDVEKDLEERERRLLKSRTDLRNREEELRSKIQTHVALKTLEGNLAALKSEVAEREREWRELEASRARAMRRWRDAQNEAEDGKPGVLSFLVSKKKRAALKEREREARERLEAGERALGGARREKEDFVREARGLREEILRLRGQREGIASERALEDELKETERELSQVSAELTEIKLRRGHPGFQPPDWSFLNKRKIFLSHPDRRSDRALPPGFAFDRVVSLSPRLWTHESRKKLLEEALAAKKSLVVLADFSPLYFRGEPPASGGGSPWKCYTASETLSAREMERRPLLKVLSPSHVFAGPGGRPLILPEGSVLTEAGGFKAEGSILLCPVPDPPGLSFRRPPETAPANPVSAVTAVQLALRVLSLDSQVSLRIVAPSETQGRLLRAMLQDFKLENRNCQAGLPEELESLPPADTVVLDCALGPPHTGHPLAKGDEANKFVLKALARAKKTLILLGNEERLGSLPPEGALGALYREAAGRIYPDRRAGADDLPFPEAVERARESIILALPPMEPLWWSQLSPRVLSALRRGVKVMVFAELPGPENRDYPGNAIRELRVAGALVFITRGFSAFTAVLDQRRFTWGEAENLPGPGAFKGLRSVILQKAAPLILDLLQLPLIREKLGPGAFRNCPSCGWPYVIVNQDRLKGFGDFNSLKLGCVNENCPAHKKPRPLDERWPFSQPPLCAEDKSTPYERHPRGKRAYWRCPRHPEGPCPQYRVIPGDPGS
jgi:hypothetical protein